MQIQFKHGSTHVLRHRFFTYRAAIAVFVLLFISPLWPSSGASDVISAVQGYTLTVRVEGVRNSVGNIGYLIFNSSRGWPDAMKEAVRGDMIAAREGTTVIQIADLRPGQYGVLVIHDENGNQKLDRDWKGIPKEQWGLSNNPRVYLSCPSYERARFEVATNTEIRIALK